MDVVARSGNVYRDLGFEDAEELLVKATLAIKIQDVVKRRRLSLMEAAGLVRIDEARLASVLSGQFKEVSQDDLIRCLARLGRDITITVGPAKRRSAAGLIQVSV